MIATTLARHCLQPAFQARALWQNTCLSYKLAAVAAVTLVIALAGLASLVADQLAEAVVDKFATGAALYSDSVVAPLIQETARRSSLSDAKRRELDSIFAPTVIKRPIVSFRIWVGNHIIYSNSPEVIGKEFAPSLSREQAWNGAVAAEINQLDSDDDAPTKELNLPILEVYAPLREAVTGRIFALAETHEIATDLLHEIRRSGAMVAFNRTDLEFVLQQILMAEAGQPPVSPHLAFGLREVSGTNNNSVPGQGTFGAADEVFPRVTDPVFRTVTVNIDGTVFDPNPGTAGDVMTTTYASTVPGPVFGVNVVDPAPRVISNLIADQTANNPAALEAQAAATPGTGYLYQSQISCSIRTSIRRCRSICRTPCSCWALSIRISIRPCRSICRICSTCRAIRRSSRRSTTPATCSSPT